MTSSLGYMELCRLCLVKDKVTVPIFGDTNDVRQIFLKITACLPVKVSRDDNLPKKICDTCLYKIDLLYQFWNTTINAEKQLIQWLNEIGVDAKNVDASLQMLPQSHAHPHAMQEEIMMKEERIESETKDGATGFSNMYTEYPYQNPENNFDTPPVVEETTTAKRKTRGRPAGKKKAKVVIPESEDEDSIGSDRLGNDDTNDSDSDGGKIAKQEADSDEDYVDNPESLEPTTFVDVPSAADAEQPGPSGLSKPATITAGTSDQGRRKRTKVDPTDPHICTICQKDFPDHHRLLNHMYNHKEKRFACALCGQRFYFEAKLRNHQKIHDDIKQFECDQCDKAFAKKDSLQVHKLRHAGIIPFKCLHCDRGFYKKHDFKNHIKVCHDGVKYICFPCNKSLTDVAYYAQHMRTHDPSYEEQDLVCPICDKVYKNRVSFRLHKKRHEGFSFDCDICDKKVGSKSRLAEHKRKHTGEKPYICQACGKGFASGRTLAVHFRAHTDEKPFSCTECSKTFTQRSSLSMHMKSHTEDELIKCHICLKWVYTKPEFLVHLKSHGVEEDEHS